jgi:hypothetical protein
LELWKNAPYALLDTIAEKELTIQFLVTRVILVLPHKFMIHKLAGTLMMKDRQNNTLALPRLTAQPCQIAPLIVPLDSSALE